MWEHLHVLIWIYKNRFGEGPYTGPFLGPSHFCGQATVWVLVSCLRTSGHVGRNWSTSPPINLQLDILLFKHYYPLRGWIIYHDQACRGTCILLCVSYVHVCICPQLISYTGPITLRFFVTMTVWSRTFVVVVIQNNNNNNKNYFIDCCFIPPLTTSLK